MTEPGFDVAGQEPSPLAAANVRVLTQRLCEVEALLDVIGRLGAQLRAELLDRAIARWREDGTAPTFRADGLGTVSLTVPKERVEVEVADAFASWVAQKHPEAATAQVAIACPPDRLEALLELLHAVVDEMPAVSMSAAVAVSPQFTKRLLEEEVIIAPAGSQTRAVIDETTGEVVEGVKVIAGADPAVADGPQPKSISVRLERQAKADAAAAAQARLGTVLERGIADALAPTVRNLADADLAAGNMPDMVDVHDLAAEGEPDEAPADGCARDGCGHPKAGHNGKTNTGKCLIVVPADVRGAADASDAARLEQDGAEPCRCSRYVAPAPVAVAW
jgi:hypothetical protein